MTLPVPPITTEIFGLLTQERTSVMYPGSMLDTVHARWTLLELNVLVELRVNHLVQAYLAFQKGQLVHTEAQHGAQQLRGRAALELISRLLPSAALRVFLLDPAPAALAFAAIAGTPVSTVPMVAWSLSEQLAQLMARRFSGAFAAQLQTGLGIWHLHDGHISAKQHLLRVQAAPALLLLRWSPQRLETVAGPSSVPDVQMVAIDDAALWRLFYGVAQTHLGQAARRVLHLMQTQCAHLHAAGLRDALAAQVERFGGAASADTFRQQALLDSLTLPPETTLEN